MENCNENVGEEKSHEIPSLVLKELSPHTYELVNPMFDTGLKPISYQDIRGVLIPEHFLRETPEGWFLKEDCVKDYQHNWQLEKNCVWCGYMNSYARKDATIKTDCGKFYLKDSEYIIYLDKYKNWFRKAICVYSDWYQCHIPTKHAVTCYYLRNPQTGSYDTTAILYSEECQQCPTCGYYRPIWQDECG